MSRVRGVTTEAMRAALPRRLAVASLPPGPVRRSGPTRRRAAALTRSGPSRATEVDRRTTARNVTGVEAGSVCRMLSRATRAAPPASSRRPARRRPRASRVTSVRASVSASAGWIRATRREAIRAAAQAPNRVTARAASGGRKPAVRCSVVGTAPRAVNLSYSQVPKGSPARAPAVPAVAPTIRASRPRSLRICPEAAAMARSRASSRWRCWTESAKVPTTTSTATSSEVPPIAPPMLTSLMRAAAASRNSTGPRACPVLSWAPVPCSAVATACRSRPGSVPAAGMTPNAVTCPGRAARRRASAVEKNRDVWWATVVAGAATPETR